MNNEHSAVDDHVVAQAVSLCKRMEKPKSATLFRCTGNACRSKMAEALLREIGGERFEACRSGVLPRP